MGKTKPILNRTWQEREREGERDRDRQTDTLIDRHKYTQNHKRRKISCQLDFIAHQIS